ncbi:unnamed protein product [Prorocentrum cordatum]|uniref:Uncharacterized protein n=1 Tax=Prorocentrum cordatum TaxID=2364126 RepID=A0ABN9PBL7_9DINO|nr:unnamed protein product [Polarella glacialis]
MILLQGLAPEGTNRHRASRGAKRAGRPRHPDVGLVETGESAVTKVRPCEVIKKEFLEKIDDCIATTRQKSFPATLVMQSASVRIRTDGGLRDGECASAAWIL